MKDTEKFTTNLLGGRVSVQSLIQDLSSLDHFVRWVVVWGLQDAKDKSVIEHLIKALNDIDKGVRFGAAKVLGWMRDEKTVVPLLKALKDIFNEVSLPLLRRSVKSGIKKASEPVRFLLEKSV